MNDKKYTQRNKKKSFMQENGFLIGLYSIVGVLVIAAIGVTFYGTGTKQNDNGALVAMESKTVGNSMDESYTSKNDFSQISTAVTETPVETPAQNISPQEPKDISENTTIIDPNNSDDKTPASKDDKQNENEKDETPDVKINDDNTTSKSTVNEVVEININSDIVSNDVLYEDEVTSVISQPVLTLSVEEDNNFDNIASNFSNDTETSYKPFFADESIMKWPLSGNILMNFSMDKMVYDKTLDQFRTNDSLYIEGKIGDEVVSAADGVVYSTGKNLQYGTFITLDHGNGWKTTYGQLDEKLNVAKGDIVKEGQILGRIGTPSNYSVEEGIHLNFKVVKNDIPINPLTMLAE